jgi:hypothetical protein
MLVVVTDGITDGTQPGKDVSFFGGAGLIRAISAARAQGGDPGHEVHEAAAAHAQRVLGDDASGDHNLRYA